MSASSKDRLIQSLDAQPVNGALWVSRVNNAGVVYVRPAVNSWDRLELEGIILDQEYRLSEVLTTSNRCVEHYQTRCNIFSPTVRSMPSVRKGDLLATRGYAGVFETSSEAWDQADHAAIFIQVFDPEVVCNAVTEVEAIGALTSREAWKNVNFADFPTRDLILHNAEFNLAANQPNDCLFYVIREKCETQNMVGQVLGRTGPWFANLHALGSIIESSCDIGMPLPENGGLYVVRDARKVEKFDVTTGRSYEGIEGVICLANISDLISFGLTTNDVIDQMEKNGWAIPPAGARSFLEFCAWLSSEPLISRQQPIH